MKPTQPTPEQAALALAMKAVTAINNEFYIAIFDAGSPHYKAAMGSLIVRETGLADLIAERDALREALQDCQSGLIYIKQSYGELYGVGWNRALNKADDALALSAGPKGDDHAGHE